MTTNLARHLNKTLFVSIPALFEDGAARPYTLLGAEMNGLWLQSNELTDRLLRAGDRELAKFNPAVFVPFAQIAGVLVATGPAPAPADEPAKDASQPLSPKRPKKR